MMDASRDKENEETSLEMNQKMLLKRRNSIMKSPAVIREENPYEEIFKESFMCSKAGKHRRNTMSSMDRRVSFGVVNIRTFQKESAESPAPIAKKKKVVVIPFQEIAQNSNSNNKPMSPYTLRSKSPVKEIENEKSPVRIKNRRRSSASPSNFPALAHNENSFENVNETVHVAFSGTTSFHFQPLEIPPDSPMPLYSLKETSMEESSARLEDDSMNTATYYSNLLKDISANSYQPNEDDKPAFAANDSVSILRSLKSIQNDQSETPKIDRLINDDMTYVIPNNRIPVMEDISVNFNEFVSSEENTMSSELTKKKSISDLLQDDETCWIATSVSTLGNDENNPEQNQNLVETKDDYPGNLQSIIDEDQTVMIPKIVSLSQPGNMTLMSNNIQSLIDDDSTMVIPKSLSKNTFSISNLLEEDDTIAYNKDFPTSFDTGTSEFTTSAFIRPQPRRATTPIVMELSLKDHSKETPLKCRRMSDVVMEVDSPYIAADNQMSTEIESEVTPTVSNLINEDITLAINKMVPEQLILVEEVAGPVSCLIDEDITMAIPIIQEHTENDVSMNTSVISDRSIVSEGSPGLPAPPVLNHGPSLLVSRSAWQEDQDRKKMQQNKIVSNSVVSPAYMKTSILKTPVGKSPSINNLYPFSEVVANQSGSSLVDASPYTSLLNTYTSLQADVTQSSLLEEDKSNNFINETSVSVRPMQLLPQMESTERDPINWNHPSLNFPVSPSKFVESDKNASGTMDFRSKLMQAEYAKILFNGNTDEMTRNITQTINLGQLSEETVAMISAQAKVLMESEGVDKEEIMQFMENLKSHQKNTSVDSNEDVQESDIQSSMSGQLTNFLKAFELNFAPHHSLTSNRQSSINGFVQKDGRLTGTLTVSDEINMACVQQSELDCYENACFELKERIERLKSSVADTILVLSEKNPPIITIWNSLSKNDEAQCQMFQAIVSQHVTKCQMETDNVWFAFRQQFEQKLENCILEQRDQLESDLAKMKSILSNISAENTTSKSQNVSNIVMEESKFRLRSLLEQVSEWKNKIKLFECRETIPERTDDIENTKQDIELLKIVSEWSEISKSEYSFRGLVNVLFGNDISFVILEQNFISKYRNRIPFEFAKRLVSSIDTKHFKCDKFEILQSLDIPIGHILDLCDEIYNLEQKLGITIEATSDSQNVNFGSISCSSLVVIMTVKHQNELRMIRIELKTFLDSSSKIEYDYFNIGGKSEKLSSHCVGEFISKTFGYNRLTKICEYLKENLQN